MELVKAYGTVVYDPDRGKLKEDKAKNTIIIEIEDGEDLAAYYRALFEKEYFIPLLKPNYQIHMTVTKVHETNGMPWGYLNGKRISIDRTQELFWNKDYLWLNAFSDDWKDIRKYYDLPEYLNGHITIGKFKEHDKPFITPHLNHHCFESE